MVNYFLAAPIEMFSLQHILALIISILIILSVFFFRKFFIKYPIADRIFRYTLAFLMLFFELGNYYASDKLSWTFAKMLPLALCSYTEILTIILLLSNSKRLCKLIFPFAMCGALLSLICVSCEQSFPSFRAFHYFINHTGFMTANLYFIFTRKVNKYTYKDFSMSCLLLLIISGVMIILNGLGVEDHFFLLTPPKALMFTKNALGQVWYSILYPLLVTLIMALVSYLAYLGTKHRKDTEEINPDFKDSKVLDKLASISAFKRQYAFIVLICVFSFITTIQALTDNFILFIISSILITIIFIYSILNEIIYNYNIYKSKG